MLEQEQAIYNLLLKNKELLQDLLTAVRTLSSVPVFQLLRPTKMQVYPVTTNATPNKAVELIFKRTAVWMIVDNNLSGANDISISFDGGTTYKTLRAGVTLNFSPFTLPLPDDFDRLTHKSATASSSFEILAGELS